MTAMVARLKAQASVEGDQTVSVDIVFLGNRLDVESGPRLLRHPGPGTEGSPCGAETTEVGLGHQRFDGDFGAIAEAVEND